MTSEKDDKKQEHDAGELQVEELGTDETEEVAGGSCAACVPCAGCEERPLDNP